MNVKAHLLGDEASIALTGSNSAEVKLPAFDPPMRSLTYNNGVFLLNEKLTRERVDGVLVYERVESWEVRYPPSEQPMVIHYVGEEGDMGDSEALAKCGKILTQWYSGTDHERQVTCPACKRALREAR